jgi:DNA-binding IclR family transcriptional regulator
MEGVHCMTVPFFARARALAGTLWIVCPADRLPLGQFRARGRILLRFSERISYHLGHRP